MRVLAVTGAGTGSGSTTMVCGHPTERGENAESNKGAFPAVVNGGFRNAPRLS